MGSSETALELEKLRAEVAALRAAKAATDAGADEAEAVSAEIESAMAEEPGEHIKSQLQELTGLLEEEIRDLPTITCLAVFTAGILLGRFLR